MEIVALSVGQCYWYMKSSVFFLWLFRLFSILLHVPFSFSLLSFFLFLTFCLTLSSSLLSSLSCHHHHLWDRCFFFVLFVYLLLEKIHSHSHHTFLLHNPPTPPPCLLTCSLSKPAWHIVYSGVYLIRGKAGGSNCSSAKPKVSAGRTSNSTKHEKTSLCHITFLKSSKLTLKGIYHPFDFFDALYCACLSRGISNSTVILIVQLHTNSSSHF